MNTLGWVCLLNCKRLGGVDPNCRPRHIVNAAKEELFMTKANVRTTIFDNGDYSLYAQISPSISPKEGLALTITSRWQSASNPKEEQVRFKACLERGGLKNLVNLIQLELGK